MIIRVLATLLALQLAVTAFVYWPRQEQVGPATALVTGWSMDGVSGIAIDDGEASVTLSRSDRGWTLNNGLPADPLKATTLLTALLEENPGYAIAATQSAAKRFSVAGDDFERRVTLSRGEEKRSVYLGTSPSFRKVHARRDEDDAIYVLDFNSYDAPTSPESWLDRTLLQLTDISEIETADALWRLENGVWMNAAGKNTTGQDTNAEAIPDLVQALASLRITGFASEEDATAAEAGEEVLSLEVESAEGRVALRLQYVEERYFIRSDKAERWFSLSSYDAERLRDAFADDLEAGASSDNNAAHAVEEKDGSESAKDSLTE